MIKRQREYYECFTERCKAFGLIYNGSKNVKFVGKKSEAFLAVYNALIQEEKNFEITPELKDVSAFYWNYYANPDSLLYVDELRSCISIEEALDIIHSCDGIAIVAHPCQYGMPWDDVIDYMNYSKSIGYDGIEAFHYSHTHSQIQLVIDYVKKNKLLLSGGSDYHGKNKPNVRIGIRSNIRGQKLFVE